MYNVGMLVRVVRCTLDDFVRSLLVMLFATNAVVSRMRVSWHLG